MKIILITPPNIHYIEPYAYVEADKSNAIRPNLGLLYVAAAVKDLPGVDVRVIDMNADELTLADLGRLLVSESPDIVGFSVLTFNLLNCMAVSEVVRKNSPRSKICFGGWHPTLYPRETLAFDCVDYVVVGEGEYSFRELVQSNQACASLLDQEQGLSHIKGLGYKALDGQLNLNSPRPVVKDLDSLPLPAYDLVDATKYSHLLACSGRVVNIMTSRGCPQKCIFCDLRRTAYRFRTPQNVIDEIQFWVRRGVHEFFIQDDNFTINRKRTIEFCRLLKDAGLKIKYKISSRVDYIDDELCDYLKKSGCGRIYFGVESGSQRILDYLQKGIDINDIKIAFKSARKHKIDCCAYIMIGVPSETQQDIDMTMNLIRDLKPNHLHCSICSPMPRTHLYAKLVEDGFIANDYWLEFAQKPDPNFKTRFASEIFNPEELRAMQNHIQKQFYFKPHIILGEIVKTRSIKQLVSKARMARKMLFS
ncbi:B12-binding domain-containing radical SAM protein [Planctomycetota bacterium]